MDGQVELGIAMKMYVVFVEDMVKGMAVDDEEKGPQDRALGHTSGNGGRVGIGVG